MPSPIPFYVTSFSVLRVRHVCGSVRVAPRSFHCLSFCLSGKLDIRTDTQASVSRAGSITFIPSGVPFTSIINEGREIIAVHFTVDGELPGDVQVFLPSQSYDFERDFVRLLETYESAGVDSAFSCMSRFYKLLGKIFCENGFKSELSGYDRRILPALDYINKNYFDKSASSVEHLASLCGFSATYLRRVFAREFGMSTSTYVKKFRIDKACAFLDTGYYSVTEAAIACGFDSPSYFAKEFKRYTDMTPSEYLTTKVRDR